jgi:hypothetical protein
MARHPRLKNAPIHADHENPVRSMVAAAEGEKYVAYRTFAEAKADPDGIVVIDGDHDAMSYVAARANLILCDEAQLQRLGTELDALLWSSPEGTRIYFESASEGALLSDVWVHKELENREAAIRNILLGKQTSIHQ